MDSSTVVGVIGAGTMGSGIAQVAAQAGHVTYLYDSRTDIVDRALAELSRTLDMLVGKGRLNAAQASDVLARIKPAHNLRDLASCGLVIEAIVEDLSIKKRVFTDLEAMVSETAILATNTSSLSVTAIAAACRKPERVIGLHFFNPAPVLPLVEVVPGIASDAQLASHCAQLMTAWGKLPVIAKDTPGFIVNRIARPFYGEALRIHEEGLADIPTIDRAMKEVGGFKMGPFELMDLIGNDINFTVTKTVWESFFYDPRYKPSITQQRMVEAGWLGRKSGRGYFKYDANGQVSAWSPPASGDPAANEVQAADPELLQDVCWRILVMLINEAAEAVRLGIATRDDIDQAMTKGVNYPKGLLKWADEKGISHCLETLERLHAEYAEDRYRPSPLLRRMVREGRSFW